ncbi:Proteasomal ubiquitin receptor ADRM1 [Trichoplax sp. H2]|nr:Proteasomal ubiquitin receptor ADRM1 [Trichoplax sp. H2]|eukprot:RDD42111.1 Proteasomal ubiquitin receptor ADRM1 [Trichoplax sp. H2]
MSFPGGYSQNLFGNLGQNMRLPQHRNLVEFKAGKMTMTGKLVKPDQRKGLLYVFQGDDSLMHFCWKDRTTGKVDDDLIIFPEDVNFSRVTQCTTGRVYVLKFRNSARKLFFWMQDIKTDKDEVNCNKVNEVLNNPSAALSSAGSMSNSELMRMYGFGGANPGLPNVDALDTTGLLSGISRPSRPHSSPAAVASSNSNSQGNSRPATATPNVVNAADDRNTTTPQQQRTTQLSDIQNILAGLPAMDSQQRPVEVDLNQMLDEAAVSSLSSNSQLLQQLRPFLPPGSENENTSERLRETLTSPPFQQALSSFSTALQSGQLGSMMDQLGMADALDAAGQGDVTVFARALETAARAGTLQDNTPPPSSDNTKSSESKEQSSTSDKDEKNSDNDHKDTEGKMDVDP